MTQRFNRGDKVRHKHFPSHTGTVIHQTGRRVLWKCRVCSTPTSDDYTDDLELIT